jgi:TPR repeat protein
MGHGVAQDYSQAVLWYRKAAEQGSAFAQYNLGVMCHEGQGVTQDYVEAHKWLNIAAAYSTLKELRDKATKARDAVAKKMTSAQIAEAQKRAKEWKKK